MYQGEDIPRGAVLSDEMERGDGRRASEGESGEQLLGWKQTNKKIEYTSAKITQKNRII